MYVIKDQIQKLAIYNYVGYNYALQGECPVYNRLLYQRQRISVIAAMSTIGVISNEIIEEVKSLKLQFFNENYYQK